jgi:hypothetical protein
VILPVWHGVDREKVAGFSPILADRIAINTDRGIDKAAAEVLKVFGGSRKQLSQELPNRYSDSFLFPIQAISEVRRATVSLGLPSTWAHLVLQRDMSRNTIWMGTDSDECIDLCFRLYAPLALFRYQEYALRRSLSTFSTESKLRFGLLESAFDAVTNEELLASSGTPLQYTPRVRGWRMKRATEPQRYWCRGSRRSALTQPVDSSCKTLRRAQCRSAPLQASPLPIAQLTIPPPKTSNH